MKKTILPLSILILIFISGCYYHSSEPYYSAKACFSTPYNEYKPNEIVEFNNCSTDANSYLWNFGDGFSSNEQYPTHKYLKNGVFQVTLTAYGAKESNSFTKVIYVTGSTDLDILVMYKGTTDPVSNCEVTLYGSQADWQNLTNKLVSGTTNSAGSIIFTNLEPVGYFIDAYKSVDATHYYSNYLLGYIAEPLVLYEVNYNDIYVELLTSTVDKNGRKKSDFVIRKVEKGSANNKNRKLNVTKNIIKFSK